MGVYANSVRNGFAFDDVAIVQQNRQVLDLKWTKIWTSNYWPTINGFVPDSLYRPLTIWSYLANQAMLPGQAWAFHLTNILLHALASVMVGVFWHGGFLGSRRGGDMGVFVCMHPIHTEAVSNLGGAAEMLAAIWSLACDVGLFA